MGSDIQCPSSRIQVQNPLLLTASITISANATAGTRDIKVFTKNEVAQLQSSFEIYNISGALRTTLEVMPVQSLSLGDIDPSNLANAPFYFWVNIFNNNVSRNVKVELSLSSDKSGQLGVAINPSVSINPNQFTRLDKSNFPKYKNSPAASAFYKQVLATGSFPPDNYTYSVKITDLKTGQVVTDSNKTTITNAKNNPELIMPGALFTDPVQSVFIPQPLFQWFGQQDHYDFNLYIIMPGQSAEEAVKNIPVYTTKGIQGNTFLYPNFAEKLIVGKEYAWQIIASISSIKGSQPLPSEVFKFVYNSNIPGQNNNSAGAKSIKIFPQQVTLTSGQQFNFSATAYDVNDVPLANLPITWSLSPTGKATVDANGIVTAGNVSGTFAVIATIGGITDYATIVINDFPAATFQNPWNKGTILKQLFGLPK